MTEAEAKRWIMERFGHAACEQLGLLVAMVTEEASRQNLIAPSTVETMWARHVVDSAQLIAFAENSNEPESWLDVGTGAGFPGLVVATLRDFPVTLVEPRKKRADFLERAVRELGISGHTAVLCSGVKTVVKPYGVISARAVAWLGELFSKSSQCAGPHTRWILPKGRNARQEVETARLAWHGVFHVEQSITDPDSLIVLASGVSRR